jgi:hypothetical protein
MAAIAAPCRIEKSRSRLAGGCVVRAVRIEEVEWTPMQNSHRNGGLLFKNILTGVEGTPENYWLTLAKGDGHFFSPRHRHNFDQIRMCMAGRTSIDPKKFMEPGEIGYFPEGTPYGPQQDDGENITLVLQFGAASRSGFLSRRELRQSIASLQTMGEFKAGVFHRTESEGRKNQDGFEAVWEHAMGRRLTYPKPRFESPIFMHPQNFAWRSTEIPGLRRKTLGVFTERETRVEAIELEAGAKWSPPPDNAICLTFVLSGTGTVDSEKYQSQTSVETIAGEQAAYHATSDTEAIRIVIPMLG